jgi:hypothetical protein
MIIACKGCNIKITTGSKTGYCRICSKKHFSVWNKGLTKKDAPQMANAGAKAGTSPPNKGRSSSMKTKIKLSCVNRGISIESFDGFTMPLSKRERCIFDDSGLRKQCFESANYICNYCFNKGGKLNAHHLNSWAENIDQRFELNNLVCLCEVCHRLIHSVFGQKTTREQYEGFKKAKLQELDLDKI